MLRLQYQHPCLFDMLATKQHKQNVIRKKKMVFSLFPYMSMLHY